MKTLVRLGIAMVGLSPTIVVAQAVSPAVVYDTSLQPGWENWSWAKTQLGVAIEGTQRKPIKVDAGPWQALALHHAPVDITGYKMLSMLIHGMGKGQHLRVFLLSDGKPVNPDGHAVTLSTNGWIRVTVPLVFSNATPRLIDQLQVQNATDQPAATFYISDIVLS